MLSHLKPEFCHETSAFRLMESTKMQKSYKTKDFRIKVFYQSPLFNNKQPKENKRKKLLNNLTKSKENKWTLWQLFCFFSLLLIPILFSYYWPLIICSWPVLKVHQEIKKVCKSLRLFLKCFTVDLLSIFMRFIQSKSFLSKLPFQQQTTKRKE